MCSLSKHVLATLTCLLAMAASGDDFWLPRLVLLGTSAAAEPLPLDDPNTDFTRVTDSWADYKSVKRAGGDAEPKGSCATAAGKGPGASSALRAISVPGGRQRPRTDLRTPLRC